MEFPSADLPERFKQLPSSLRDNARAVRLGDDVPTLLVHPDWETPAPCVFWMHGRTVHKELDPGRYLRWMRAGSAACAIDLPGHGERFEEGRTDASASPGVIKQAIGEIDGVVGSLDGDLFDPERMGIGGMSLGGMVALRRLCDPHGFRAAAVEGTTGDLKRLYEGRDFGPDGPAPIPHDAEILRPLDAGQNLEGFRPIPLLSLHSEKDMTVPWAVQSGFLEMLRERYRAEGAEPGLIESVTWEETGAPYEHAGFGRHSNDAKNAQTEFFSRTLG